MTVITKAVSTWSLHRTLGRYAGPDSAVGGGPFLATPDGPAGMALLELPAELRRRGYDALHICHFHLPSRDASYLAELRAALSEAEIELDTLLIDDGDLSDQSGADHAESWIGDWLGVAAELGAKRARVGAGRSAPTPELLQASARRLVRLAEGHSGVRVVTENWLGMTPDAASVHAVLEETGDRVGLLIDLGNWRGAWKYDALAQIAPLAETCHAKCSFGTDGPDAVDFRQSLSVLKDAGYAGPLALIYDGPDGDEWGCLETEWELVREVFG